MARPKLQNAYNMRSTKDNLEDLLATDDLFIQYFNTFLQLPTFPEPLCFNKETRGFEVVTDARKKLASEIKNAVRAGRRRKRIYRPTRNHSFSDIPLIPLEDPPPPEEKEIDTSFTVQTLNKEQGIQWIKVERLPSFLESDCYREYQLAKLISQTHMTTNQSPGKYVTVKVDHKAKVKTEKKVELLEPEEELKTSPETQGMLSEMYVCMGNTSTTDTEAWVSQARLATHPNTTAVTPSQSVSSVLPPTTSLQHPPSAMRPASALSRPRSGVRPTSAVSFASRGADSGFWSPRKGSATGSSAMDLATAYSNSIIGAEDQDIDACPDDQKDIVLKPITPRPSDKVCAIAEGTEGKELVFATLGDQTLTDQASEDGGNDSDQPTRLTDPSSVHSTPAPTLNNIDEVGAVVVGTVLKHAVAEVSGQCLDDVKLNPDIQNLFMDQRFLDVNKSQLQKLEVGNPETVKGRGLAEILELQTQGGGDLREVDSGRASDEDSLLNSDEDYDEERDAFFHKQSNKVQDLSSSRGVIQFKKFLKGTRGERNWNLWLDIERAKVTPFQELNSFLAAMREKYQRAGSPYELPRELKAELRLIEPSHWTLDRLTGVQDRVLEPLLLYWAPRYLVKQKAQANPNQNFLYHHQKIISAKSEPYPNPPTISLLPLRPKACMPKMAPEGPVITPLFDSAEEPFLPCKTSEPLPVTTPPVGMKRSHSSLDHLSNSSRVEKNKENQRKTRLKKTPKDLITPLLSVTNVGSGKSQQQRPPSRPPSAPPILGQPRKKDPWDLTSNVSASRPSSAASSRKDSETASEVSEFLGGQRMEGLLQALDKEKQAGHYFRKFVQQAGNQLWKNSLRMWEELQQYHHMFYSDVIEAFGLKKKAQAIYSKHIVAGAPLPIHCNNIIREDVYRKLDPPYEELFDDAEEYLIAVLYDAWTQMLVTDVSTFDKVELIEVKRHLDAKSKYVTTLQRRGIIKERPTTPDDPMEGYQDPVYDSSLLDNIPEEFKEYGLEKLVHNRIELEHYRQFLADNYASMDLMCWMDIEAFKRIPHTDEKKRDAKAKEIKTKYLNKKYFFGPNSPAGKEGQDKVMEAGGGWGKLLEDRPPTPCLLEAQKYVQERLEKKWLPLFLATEGFAERQRPKSGMDDAVEDVMIQRKKKAQAIYKMLESKWVSSSKEILTFRKALLNPITSHNFRRYVSIKGDNYENDVLFWQEVQKYKDLCHLHSDRSLIQQKVAAIINCFIDSPIPPSLQIDVTQDMADRIMNRKMEVAPYLFREAQLTVFRVLFSQWTGFCHYRSKVANDKILPTIERLKRRARAKEKKKQKEMDEKREKVASRKKSTAGSEEDGEDDAYHDPFEQASVNSEDAAGSRAKESVSWSYSQYLNAMEEQEVLNEVDESTFASSMSSGQTGNEDDDSDDDSDEDDDDDDYDDSSSLADSVSSPGGDKADQDTVSRSKSSRQKKSKGRLKLLKPTFANSEIGSQRSSRAKSARGPRSVASTKETHQNREPRSQRTDSTPKPGKTRLAHGMPPLIRKD